MIRSRVIIALFVGCCIFCSMMRAAETPTPPYTGSSGETVLSLGQLQGSVPSPDGKILAAWNKMGIFIWDLTPEPQLRHQFIPYSDIKGKGSLEAYILPNNRLLTVTTVIQIFDLNTLSEIQSFPLDSIADEITYFSSAVSNDGSILVMEWYSPHRLQKWNLVTGLKEKETIIPEDDWIACMSISPDNKNLLLTGRNNQADLWDMANMQPARTLQHGTGYYYKNCFSPDGQYAVAGTENGILVKWNVATGEKIFETSNHPGIISTVQFTTDGKNILTSHENQYLDSDRKFLYTQKKPALILCDSNTGKESQAVSTPIRSFYTMKLAGNRLYGIEANYLLTGFDIQTGTVLWQIGKEFFFPSEIAVSPDNEQIAVLVSSSKINIYDRKTWAIKRSIDNGEKCDQLQFSPNSKWLLAINIDGILNVWDALTGNFKRKIEVFPKEEVSDTPAVDNPSPYWISSVQFFPDNLSILVLATDPDYKNRGFNYGGLLVYSIETDNEISRYSNKGIDVAMVSPAGKVILLYSNRLEMWDSSFTTMDSTIPVPVELGPGTINFTDDGSILYAYYFSSHYELDWKTKEPVHLIPDTKDWIDLHGTIMNKNCILLSEVRNKMSSDDVVCQFINWKTGEILTKLPATFLAKLTADQSHLVTNSNNQLKVWDINHLLNKQSGIVDYLMYR